MYFLGYTQNFPACNFIHFSENYVNPAVSGKDACAFAQITNTNQWLGVNGAPATQSFLGSTRLEKAKSLNSYHGISVLVNHDKNADYSTFGVHADYAFHMLIRKESNTYLSLGLRFSFGQAILNESQLDRSVFDPLVTGVIRSVWNPNASTGLYIYNSKFFGGFSALQLLPSISNISENNTNTFDRMYFLQAGVIIPDRSENYTFLPEIRFIADEKIDKYLDVQLKALIRDKFMAAIAYRHSIDVIPGTPNAIISSLGLNINNFYMTYFYSLGLSGLQQHFNGVHNILLGYRICFTRRSAVDCPVYN